jgi:hypothetical protein
VARLSQKKDRAIRKYILVEDGESYSDVSLCQANLASNKQLLPKVGLKKKSPHE